MFQRLMADLARPGQIIGLVATYPREAMLLARSVPSMAAQERRLDALVIAADLAPLSADAKRAIVALLQPVPVYFTQNTGLHGVAGTLNAGLAVIARHWPQSYVAILDDDDHWDPEHIAVCSQNAAAAGWPDIVISGLRVWKNGIELPRPLPRRLRAADFLAGNPGWQGSNTFVKFSSAQSAGNFTAGLVSSSDRDFAIRMLNRPKARIAYSGKYTSNWICGESREALSAAGSEQKLVGLAQFYALYGHHMTRPSIRAAFFHRAKSVFEFEPGQILDKMEQLEKSGQIPRWQNGVSPRVARYSEILERLREFKPPAFLTRWWRNTCSIAGACKPG